MARLHQFHRDLGDHSVTVTVREGVTTEAMLLVDGREVGLQRFHGHGLQYAELSGELPDEPARPFTVHFDRGPQEDPALRCSLDLEGHRWPLPESP
ncbi:MULTISPECIES: hypothetical protein [Kitasatospora]|uniref:Uncharacterized protein n=2 Tax=Kitasatospora TaxID=2063 RepID=A0ABT1IT33_9ACTN|nr:hypothetical protein [Kitasatospora paracochleata]MCP2308277.1 hypothetical protein [Kitasatospora paracochleata]